MWARPHPMMRWISGAAVLVAIAGGWIGLTAGDPPPGATARAPPRSTPLPMVPTEWGLPDAPPVDTSAAGPSAAQVQRMPADDPTVDDALPGPLAGFAKSRDVQFLFDPEGLPIRVAAPLTRRPAAWHQLAMRLIDDAEQLRHVVRWLAGQQDGAAPLALAHFWAECLRAGVVLPLTAQDLAQVQRLLVADGGLPDTRTLAELARSKSLPEPFIVQFQQLRMAQPQRLQEVEQALRIAAEPDLAQGLAALADRELLWRLALTDSGTPAARDAAVEILVSEADGLPAQLISRAGNGGGEALSAIASTWAARQLSGERLEALAKLYAQGAFQGPQALLFDVLLNHAEDQASARQIAIQVGRPWRGRN